MAPRPCFPSPFSRSSLRLLVCGFILSVALTPPAAARPTAGERPDGTPDKRIIRVVGTAEPTEDPAGSKEAAIGNGLGAALDRAALEVVSDDLWEAHFPLILEALHRETDALIESYRPLSEGHVAGGRYRILVEATISTAVLRERLSGIGAPPPAESPSEEPGVSTELPRLLFFISEQGIADAVPRFWWGDAPIPIRSFSEIAMVDALKSKGFPVIEPGMEGEESALIEAIPDIPNLPVDRAAALGREFGADAVILGSALAQKPLNIIGEDVSSFKGSVDAEAVWTATGETAGTVSETAVELNSDEIAGGMDALSKAGTVAAEALSEILKKGWEKKARTEGMVRVIVGGTQDLGRFVMFRKALAGVPGVAGIQISEMRHNEAAIDVTFGDGGRLLWEALEAEDFDAFGLKLYEATERELRIELLPGDTEPESPATPEEG